MTDWGFDSAAAEHVVKAIVTGIEGLNKILDRLSRRKKATRPDEQRDLEKELDALQADLQRVVELLTQALSSNRKVWQAVVDVLGPMYTPEGFSQLVKFFQQFAFTKHTNAAPEKLNEVIAGLERRLTALERAPEDPGERAPKPKRRKVSKPKRRRR
jgi:hypothetical protein